MEDFCTNPGEYIKNSAKEIEKLHKILEEIDLSSLYADNDYDDQAMRKLFGEHYSTDAFANKLANVVDAVLEHGISFKDAFGLSDSHMEAFYFLGFDLFKNERYSHAFQIFKVLSILDPFNWKYVYALATTMHRQRNYQGAIKSYLLASTMDPDRHSPLPHYHCADCYMSLNDINSAILSLGIAMSFCNMDLEEHRIIYQRSEVLKSALEEKMISSLKG